MDVLTSDAADIDSKSTVGRTPKCTRCRNHGVVSDLRGHKYKCYWRTCSCPKCLISCHKQRETADRIALFRQQVREAKEMDKVRKCEPEDTRRVEEMKKCKYCIVYIIYLLCCYFYAMTKGFLPPFHAGVKSPYKFLFENSGHRLSRTYRKRYSS